MSTEKVKKETRKTIKLQAKCAWAKIITPSKGKFSEQPLYTIALALTDAQYAKLKEKGYQGNPNVDNDGVAFYNFKRKTLNRDGDEVAPLPVIGRDKLPVTTAVGNGSDVIVVLELNDYDNEFGTGVSFRIGAVQVIDHVVYEASNPHADAFEQLGDAGDEEVI